MSPEHAGSTASVVAPRLQCASGDAIPTAWPRSASFTETGTTGLAGDRSSTACERVAMTRSRPTCRSTILTRTTRNARARHSKRSTASMTLWSSSGTRADQPRLRWSPQSGIQRSSCMSVRGSARSRRRPTLQTSFEKASRFPRRTPTAGRSGRPKRRSQRCIPGCHPKRGAGSPSICDQEHPRSVSIRSVSTLARIVHEAVAAPVVGAA